MKFRTTYLIKLLLIMSNILVIMGCTTPSYQDYERPELPIRDVTVPDSFTFESGDTISIKFFHNKELNEDGLLIRPDGKISLQLVGDVQAKGKTVEELRENLIEKYKSSLEFPEISVIVRTIHDKKIFVGGEVARQGEYLNNRSLNPFQAILMAGGYKSTAELSSVIVLRDTGKPVLDYYIIDLKNNLRNLKDYRDIKLQEFDIVYVPPSRISNVNEFVELYISRIIPSWFNVFVTYELNPIDP